jgi:fibronectin-binding autotransporter adhesin
MSHDKARLFPSKLIATLSLSALIMAAMLHQPSHANPSGGAVVAGGATITTNGTTTQINQSTNKAVINWQDFSIGHNEETRFNQPSSSSVTLNRVTGNNISNIYGKLSANGVIWLLNPAGIVFHQGSQVDVAGLIASTANINDDDFMNGNYRLKQATNSNASIINNGIINAGVPQAGDPSARERGLVALVAPNVKNNGTINARLGKVTLASGTEYTVDLDGDGQLIQFATGKKTEKANVTNSGEIYADGGQVVLTTQAAENIVDSMINMDGVVEARSIGTQGGQVVLAGNTNITQVSGTIDVSGLNSGETGGKVYITGKKIGLINNAKINASGKTGGGEVLIGGDYKGEGVIAKADQAQRVYIDKDATIEADATDKGNGGKIIAWSDTSDSQSLTIVHGILSARGGPNGGNGGLVETSSGLTPDIAGARVNTLAPLGKTGTWLLDPADIAISTGASSSFSVTSNNWTFTDQSQASYVINNSDLVSQLTSSNIVISTTQGTGGTGNITISAPITLSGIISTNSLTLNANNQIIFNSGSSINIGGSITLNGTVVLNTGVTLTAGGSITFDNHTISGNGQTLTLDASGGIGNIILTGGAASLASLTATAGSGGTITIGTGGSGSVTTTGNQTYNSAVLLGGDTTAFTTTSNGTITFGSTIDNEAHLVVGTGTSGTVIFNGQVGYGNGGITLKDLLVNGTGTTRINNNIKVNNTGNGGQIYNNNVVFGSGAITLTGIAGTGGAGFGVKFLGTIEGASSGTANVTLTSGTGNVVVLGSTVGTNTPLGSLTISANPITTISGNVTTTGAQAYNSAVTLGGNATLTSSGSTITFGSTINGDGVASRALALSANTNTLAGIVGGSTALSSLTITGATALNSGATAITTTGAQAYNGAVTLSNGASYTLTGSTISFGSTINGAGNLTLTTNSTDTSSPIITLGGAVNINALAATAGTANNGIISIGGNVTTAINTSNAGQEYYGNVLLGANVTLDTGSGTNSILRLDKTVTGGNHSLTLNNAGTTHLNGNITGVTTLTTNAGGTTQIGANVTAITTSGAQTYNDAITLNNTNAVTLTSGGALTFGSTVTGLTSGGNNLTLSFASGTVNVGSSYFSNIKNFTSSGNGTIHLVGTFTTAGSQTYNNAVTLNTGSNVTLTTSDGNISFGSTVNGGTGLIVNAGSHDVTFAGNIGGSTALTSLTATGDTINIGSEPHTTITTSGNQTYNGAVALNADTSTFTTTSGNLTFSSTINNHVHLILNTGSSGITTLNGAVGSTAGGLKSLLTSTQGTTYIKANVTINEPSGGGAHYRNAVILDGNNITLTALGAGSQNIFSSTINGSTNLTLTATAGNVFNANIGNSTPLASLTSNGATILDNNSTITSSGAVTFGGTVNGAHALTVNTDGLTTFSSTIGNSTALSSLTINGASHLYGGTIAAATQSYGGNITLDNATTFNGNVSFTANSDVDAGSNNVIFAGNVSGSSTLTLSSPTQFTLNNAQISANILNIDNTLVLPSTVDGNVTTVNINNADVSIAKGEALVISNGSGTLNITAGANRQSEGAITNTLPITLTSLTATQTLGLGGDWITTGASQFQAAVNLVANTSLNSTLSNIIFDSTINGAKNLVLTAGGIITLDGDVGSSTRLGNFTTNSLVQAGDLMVSAANIVMSNLQGDDVSLDGTNGVFATLIVNALTLGGQNGGVVNGTIGGFSDFRGALLTRLAADAAGDFIVNGCLLPGTCAETVLSNEPLQLEKQAIAESEKAPVCTMDANGNSSSDCGGIIKIDSELTALQ